MRVYRSGYRVQLDGGVAEEPRFGFLVEKAFHGYDWAIGDQSVPFRLVTDPWNSAYIYGRGLSAERSMRRSKLFVFAGATSNRYALPYLNTASTETPAALVFFEHKISPQLRFVSQNVISDRQTSIQTLVWTPYDRVLLAMAGGIGSNEGYWASSAEFRRGWIEFIGSYALTGSSFRRIGAASVYLTESDRGNFQVTLRPSQHFSCAIYRKNLLSVSVAGGQAPERGMVNGLSGSSAGLAGIQVHGSVFSSQNSFGRTTAATWGIRRSIGYRVEAGADFFRTRFDRSETSQASITFREMLLQRLALTQSITHTMGRTSVNYGGQFSSNLLSLNVGYLTQFVPFGPEGHGLFRQAMQLSLQFQLWNAHANLTTTVDPLGRVKYTAYGSDYLYGPASATSRGSPGIHLLPKYVVHGIVVDEDGHPVPGAAVQIGKELAFSDSDGIFVVRAKNTKKLPIQLLLNDFMYPGIWTVVNLPQTATPKPESKAERTTVVLHRVR